MEFPVRECGQQSSVFLILITVHLLTKYEVCTIIVWSLVPCINKMVVGPRSCGWSLKTMLSTRFVPVQATGPNHRHKYATSETQKPIWTLLIDRSPEKPINDPGRPIVTGWIWGLYSKMKTIAKKYVKRKKYQQNGAKFRHLKDPFFILCCNTKAYRIIQERRSLSLNSIRPYT